MSKETEERYAAGISKIALAIVEMSHEEAKEDNLSLEDLDNLMREHISSAIGDLSEKVSDLSNIIG